jgi:ribonuclease HII
MLLPYHTKGQLEAGCDEAGRGCLAGPVYAAAVILPVDFFHPLLNDSKQLSEVDRYALRPIIEQEAIAYSAAKVSHTEIDKTNILKASIKAMHLAIAGLALPPDLLLIDGNRFQKYKAIPHLTLVKGDAIFASIAAASILAKTYRDDEMMKLHKKFPMYAWDANKGYGTLYHRTAIAQFGRCKWHRKTFVLKSEVAAPSLF